MLAAAVISFLAGMVLAQRFKVLILVPIILLTLVVVIPAGIIHAQAWTAGQTCVLVICGLQFGYFSGLGLRQIMVARRASRRRRASLSATMPPLRSAH